MDGVLVDFRGGVLKLYQKYGLSIPEVSTDLLKYSKKVSNIVMNSEEFWLSLEEKKITGDLLKKYRSISYVASSPNIELSATPKLKWLENKFGKDIMKRTVLTASKHLLAKNNRVLIDDDVINCNRFVEHGGRAILFDGYLQTIRLREGYKADSRIAVVTPNKLANLLEKIIKMSQKT